MPAVERHLHAASECTRDALHPCACQDRAGRHLGTPLAQRVHVLDQLAHVVGGTRRPAWYVTGYEHDASTSHPRDLRNTAHSRAADNPFPPAPSSAKIRRSLSPGISGAPAPAGVRPAADGAETTHLLAPSPKGSVSKDWTQRLPKRDTGPLAADITPQPCREQLAPACIWPTDCNTGGSPGGQST
jgi:hypothetical protein